MDIFLILVLLWLVAGITVLFLGVWYLLRYVTVPTSEHQDWSLSENCPPERAQALIDPLEFKTLQTMNQLSQQRYSELQRAEFISVELLRKVQEITGEQL